jgi:hypothetical protein
METEIWLTLLRLLDSHFSSGRSGAEKKFAVPHLQAFDKTSIVIFFRRVLVVLKMGQELEKCYLRQETGKQY